MDTIRIVELPVPAPGTSIPAGTRPPAVYQAWHDIFAESMVEILGHDDFADPPAALAAGYADQKHTRKTLLLAVTTTARDRAVAAGVEAAAAVTDPADAITDPADAITDPATVLGYAAVSMPLTDNTHLAHVDLAVRPAARRRGIGGALWREVERRARAAGRSAVTTWSSHASEAPEGAGALVPPTGAGRIATDDPATRFALAHGFSLEQGERQSTLRLPVDPSLLAGWRAEAEAAAGGDYRVVQWQDRTPERWLDALAELQRRMSVDVPVAGLDFQEEVWDAARVRDMDEDIARAGQRYVLTAVEHVPTGSLVAFTHLVMPQAQPEVVFQYNTLVHGDHRGRRLGLLVKAANLQLLAAAQPAARRVHTWNAGENAHMLAINVRMGFVLASIEGAWQRRLDVAGATSAPAEITSHVGTDGATADGPLAAAPTGTAA
ncbi:GNAT family N-acetyltransferase [Georgenia subflava]|uniref:GNAT family N-acetyltransferase n=1 Tax=Georgenia subflava TaxID=1622177 RepID=A0A6N7EH17_9MICO|nr:GNAT family N-acetyltransferase [Georgenia subflava]MPV37429.1 GNAT family N-acetyltransferase [Georgenia subflava]